MPTFRFLYRLLRDRNLVASELRFLNSHSRRAGWQTVKRSVVTRAIGEGGQR